MKLKEAAALVSNLFEIEEISLALTPDGRWKLLQAFLKKNKRWRKQVNSWLQATPDEALIELREWIGTEAEIPVAMLRAFITAEIETRVKSAIEVLQACYKERLEADERKEIVG